jgi:2'-5' RNA ligase
VTHDRTAIDIALLLPEAVNQRAKAANAALIAERPDGFRFDASHLPHITLVQQFIRRANIPALIERMDPILRGIPPLSVRVTGVGSSATAAHFAIETTHELDRLHRTLMDVVLLFEEAGGGADAFCSEGEPAREPARDTDVAWVSNFRSHSSYARFAPHITLGIGPSPAFREPFEFTTDRVALCHLGRFCTCRVVLREWGLVES